MAQGAAFSSSDGEEGAPESRNQGGAGSPLPLLNSQSSPAEKEAGGSSHF